MKGKDILKGYKKLFFLLVFIMISSICSAEGFKQRGSGEIFCIFQQMSGDSTSGMGISLELDDFTAFGFGYGYNFNNNFNLNFDMFFSSTDVTSSDYSTTTEIDSSIWGYDLNLDFNILQNQFTPMITGGIGFINFSGDVVGFIFNETDFSYNFGVGFRWDVTDHFLIKGLYKSTWTKLKDTDQKIMFDGIGLFLGYVF
jgi:opacity protein-like surface antigen